MSDTNTGGPTTPAGPTPPAGITPPKKMGTLSPEAAKISLVTGIAITVCLVVEALFAAGTHNPQCSGVVIFGVLALVSACALALGSVVGFIFGVPKSGAPRLNLVMTGTGGQGTVSAPASAAGNAAGNAAAAEAAGQMARNYKPNTNLEVMSDWLAGAIVGAGLVGLKDFTKWFGDTCHDIAAWMPHVPHAGITAGAAILGFFSLGFLAVYLLTRLFLTEAFEKADGNGAP